MKSKDQIIRQIRLYKFTDEEWKKVLAFCNNLHGTGFTKPFRGKYDCNYSQFVDWVDNGLASGDIVRCGQTAAVIAYAAGGDVYYSAYFDMDENLIDCKGNYYKAKNTNLQVLTGTEAKHYYNIISEAGYRVSVKNSLLILKTPVKIGQMRYFEHQGVMMCGIVSKTGDEITFCYGYSKDNFILADIAVSANDVQDVVLDKEAEKIENEIANEHHVKWHRAYNKLCCLSSRVPKGQRCYYITDKFSISAVIDTYAKAIDMRYETGNYFCSLEDAMLFLKKLKALKDEMVINHEIR